MLLTITTQNDIIIKMILSIKSKLNTWH
jgi:hypothetical protein